MAALSGTAKATEFGDMFGKGLTPSNRIANFLLNIAATLPGIFPAISIVHEGRAMNVQRYCDNDLNQLSGSSHDAGQPIMEMKQALEKDAERSCKLEHLVAQLAKDINLQAVRIANATTKWTGQGTEYQRSQKNDFVTISWWRW